MQIVGAELTEDKEYASMGKSSADRVNILLGKLDCVRRSKELGYEGASEGKLTSNKFIGSVQEIFKNLPQPLKWLSFYLNDLPLLIDFCGSVLFLHIVFEILGQAGNNPGTQRLVFDTFKMDGFYDPAIEDGWPGQSLNRECIHFHYDA